MGGIYRDNEAVLIVMSNERAGVYYHKLRILWVAHSALFTSFCQGPSGYKPAINGKYFFNLIMYFSKTSHYKKFN